MALTQELDDECEEIGSKIVLTSNIIEEEGSPIPIVNHLEKYLIKLNNNFILKLIRKIQIII